MKKFFAVLLLAVFAGCASDGAVLPSLEGKPRIKINTTPPAEMKDATVFPANQSQAESPDEPKEQQ